MRHCRGLITHEQEIFGIKKHEDSPNFLEPQQKEDTSVAAYGEQKGPKFKKQDSVQSKKQAAYGKNLGAISWLEKTYPDVFDRKNRKPLKRGLFKDILAQGSFPYSNILIRRALNFYTGHDSYHEAVVAGTHRCDLGGHPVEEIFEQEKAYSQGILDQRKLKQERPVFVEKVTSKTNSSEG